MTTTSMTSMKAVAFCTVVVSFFTLHLMINIEQRHGKQDQNDNAPILSGARASTGNTAADDDSFSACILWME